MASAIQCLSRKVGKWVNAPVITHLLSGIITTSSNQKILSCEVLYYGLCLVNPTSVEAQVMFISDKNKFHLFLHTNLLRTEMK